MDDRNDLSCISGYKVEHNGTGTLKAILYMNILNTHNTISSDHLEKKRWKLKFLLWPKRLVLGYNIQWTFVIPPMYRLITHPTLTFLQYLDQAFRIVFIWSVIPSALSELCGHSMKRYQIVL